MAEQATRAGRKALKRLIRPVRPLLAELLTLSGFVNLLALAVPVFVLQVYDRVVFHAGISTLTALTAGMGVVILFDLLLRQTRARVMQRAALRIDVAVSRALYDKLGKLPLRVLETRPAAYWMSLQRDVEAVRNAYSGASTALLSDLPFAILYIGLIWIIAEPIVWVLAVAAPAFVVLAAWSSWRLHRLNKREHGAGLRRDQLAAELAQGRETVKALALAEPMRARWESLAAEAIEGATRRGRAADFYGNIGMSLTILVTVALTGFGALAILDQEMTIGALIAANILAGRAIAPFNNLIGHWRTFAAYRVASRRLAEVFGLADDRDEAAIALEAPKGVIELEQASFAYAPDAAPIVDKLGLILRPGGVHAVIGRSGAGKTTLLKLIAGLYAPNSGRVLIDGADLQQFTRAELQRWIGWGAQGASLFSGSIRDNIAMARDDLGDEAIVEAATHAGAHGFITDLPDGYGSEVGEGGSRLSAGERHRVVLARALLGAPPVIALDEPTAFLDREAEAALGEKLRELAKTRNVIVATHSPALAAMATNVIAIDRGRLIAAGPSAEVLAKLGAGGGPRPIVAARSA